MIIINFFFLTNFLFIYYNFNKKKKNLKKNKKTNKQNKQKPKKKKVNVMLLRKLLKTVLNMKIM